MDDDYDLESPVRGSRDQWGGSSREDRGASRQARDDQPRSRGSGPFPRLFTVHRAVVRSTKPYGAFVELQGFDRQALLHKSQVSSHAVEDIAEVVSIGDPLFVKVIAVAEEEQKINVSLKGIDQSTGADSDPTHIQAQQDAKRHTNLEDREQKAITLDAVLNVVCSKCGTRGHLPKDCFNSDTGKQYSLVTEADEGPAASTQGAEASERKRHKKEKKDKKDKKEKKDKKDKKDKKHHHDRADPPSSDKPRQQTYDEYMEQERRRREEKADRHHSDRDRGGGGDRGRDRERDDYHHRPHEHHHKSEEGHRRWGDDHRGRRDEGSHSRDR